MGRMLINAVLSLVVVAGSAMPAFAQGGGGGGGGGSGGGRVMMQMRMGGPGGGMMGMSTDAPFDTADMGRVGQMLKLTPDQLEAAKALYEGYLPEFKAKADAQTKFMDDLREQFRETRDFTIWQDAAPKFREWMDYRTGWEKKVLADVQTVLSPEQQGQWPRVERMRRRESTLGRGFIAGERADVVRMVEDLKLPEDKATEVAPILEAYELELDRELVERNKMFEDGMNQGQQLMRDNDMEKLQELFAKGREASIKVRDVNRKYARQLQGALAPDVAAKFESEFKKQSFPMVYRDRYPTQAMSAAMEMTDLEPSQREAIVALKDTFTRENDAMNTRHEKAVEEQEASMNIGRMMMGGMGGGEAMREVREARRTLEQQTMDKLKAVLSPEQYAKLPERRAADDMNMGGGRRGQMGGGNNEDNGGAGGGAGGNGGEQPRRRRPNNPAAPAPAPAPAPAGEPK